MARTGRPKGTKQARNESKYWLPSGVVLKPDQTNDYNKETRLLFIDSEYGEFTSYFRALQDANASTHPMSISRRRAMTNLSKYGVENPGANKEIRLKAKNTMVKKYGVEHALQKEEFLTKSRATFALNYEKDVTSPFALESIQEKSKRTLMNNYSVTNPMQNSEIKQRLVDTCMERYNLTNGGGTPQSVIARHETLMEQGGGDSYASKEELELRDYIQSLGFITEKKYVGGSKPFEIDVYIPELRIGFEYNGLWAHCEARLKEFKTKHKFKTDMCQEQGIRLIHVFGHHWEDNKHKIKSIIKSILRKNEHIVYARNCEIRVIDKPTSNDFLNRYHLLGGINRFEMGLGLYYKDELVSIVTIGKHHRNSSELLLNRFCVKPGYTVTGGLSRLSSHLTNYYPEFYTFIDKMYASSLNWINTGWEFVYDLDPDYFYLDSKTGRVKSKQSLKKSKSNNFHDGGSEREYALSHKIYRVYDSGKIKLKYTKK